MTVQQWSGTLFMALYKRTLCGIKSNAPSASRLQRKVGDPFRRQYLVTSQARAVAISQGLILLRPGGGHIEINMFRAFFDIYFDVILEDLAKLFGFQSEKAISYCKKAIDHHKTWDIIRTALEETSAEMVLPYVRMCLQKGQSPTAQSLKDHFSSISSMKMQVLFQAVTRYLLAIVLFRNGLGRNNSLAMQSARHIFCPIWFAREHHIYRQIEFSDTIDRLL